MPNIYIATNYNGHGAVIGAFTSIRKLVNYIKDLTTSSQLVFNTHINYENWIGVGYIYKQRGMENNIRSIKVVDENKNIVEENTFEIKIAEHNPIIEKEVLDLMEERL